MGKRNIFLDYIRAAACILVVLYHYTWRVTELFGHGQTWGVRVSWGYMAVAAFFMLSGYLAVVKDEGKLSLWSYGKKKILRLFPAYWVCIPITFVVTTLVLPSRAVSLRDMLLNFTMLESFLGIGLVDGAYWTLANELIFYAFVALVVVILKKRDKLPAFGFLWLLLLFVYQFMPGSSLLFAAAGKLIARQYGHMFVFGASLFFLTAPQTDKRMRRVSAVNLLLALVYQYLVFGVPYFAFFALTGLLIAVCVKADSSGYVIPQNVRKILYPLEVIAAVSYPWYLIHQNVGYAIMHFEIQWFSASEWIILLPGIITFLIAYAIHRYIEIPIGKIAGKQNKPV